MAAPEDASPDFPFDYGAVQLAPRHDGWTGERQHRFLTVLADTGQVSLAARAAGVSPRSAYRLRHHKNGRDFRVMWDKCLYFAADRLAALAFERAIEGTPEQIWKNGELVGEVRRPPIVCRSSCSAASRPTLSVRRPSIRRAPRAPWRGNDPAPVVTLTIRYRNGKAARALYIRANQGEA